MSHKEELLSKIQNKSVRVAIVGLGTLGLPLAVMFARRGISVLGFERDLAKVEKLTNGQNYIRGLAESHFREALDSGNLTVTTDCEMMDGADAFIVSVSSVRKLFRKPDVSNLERICIEVSKYMRPGSVIVHECKHYPTDKANLVTPIIEIETGMKHGEEFWLVHTPEKANYLHGKSKVVSGLGQDAVEIGYSLYSLAMDDVRKG